MQDPYLLLNLHHTATGEQIKRSYHELARRHHPDRYANAPEAEKVAASQRFASIAQAYALLSDAQRKARYDHIHKYGGFDDENEKENKVDEAGSSQNNQHTSRSRKRKSTGIGYTCFDPLAVLRTGGRVQSKMSHCGVQIPSRLHLAQPNSVLPFTFTVSSSEHINSPRSGTCTYTSSTTSLIYGKKYTKMKTIICYPDGRKEIIIQGNGHCERRFEHGPAEFLSNASSMKHQEPWYIGAWHGLKDRLSMCYSPCTAVTN